jgi:hypothetical protein
MERPTGFPEALHVLWSWVGERVDVTDRAGCEWASVVGRRSDDRNRATRPRRRRRGGRLTRQTSPHDRAVGFPEALRVLWSWVGERVEVRITNRQGRELTSPVAGVLSDNSEGDQVEFGVYELDDEATTVPVPLEAPYRCLLGDGHISVTTAGDIVVLFSRPEQVATA